MNTTPFPALSAETLLAVNTVGQWLAQNDFSGEQPYSSDCVVLAGNAVIPTIDAACRIAKAQGVPLLISGGIGHSTPFLYAVIARHPRYHTIRTSGRAEAAILADIANQFWHIPAEKIWLEDRSTNCGENARFSCALIRQAKENNGYRCARPHHAAAHYRGIPARDKRRHRCAALAEFSWFCSGTAPP